MVLRAIAASNPNELSFVVTDLWLDNSQLLTTGSVALGAPLKQILDSGRSVAIYGLPAPYAGQVYDMPSGPPVTIDAKRPLFLVAIGPIGRLRDVDANLRLSPSHFISDGMTSGAIRHSIFTLTPLTSAAAGATPFNDLTPNPTLQPAIAMRGKRGVTIQQLVVHRSGLNAAAVAGTQAPQASWTGPSDDSAIPGAVWKGPVAPHAQLWRHNRDAVDCRETDWDSLGDYKGGWTAAAPGSARPSC